MESQQYKQADFVDFVTESNEIKKRGGKRDNAGRKSIHGGETKIIRVNVELIPAIEKLKSGQIDFVTESNQNEIAGLKAELATSYRDNQSQFKAYQAEYDTLKENLNQIKTTNTTLTRQNTKLSKENEQLKIDLKNHDTANATFIRQLKHEHKEILESWSNQCEKLQTELDQYQAASLRLAEDRDKQYNRAVALENQVFNLKRQPDQLRAEITRLKHLEHDCQAIKANGERCNRAAKGKVNFHGVLINVCLQHQNQLIK